MRFLQQRDMPGAAGLDIGVVMLVLGMMHFFNMFNISRMRRSRKARARSEGNAGARPNLARIEV
jgi:hypothetical protein